MDTEEFLAHRYTSLEEAISFEKAAMCMQSCQLPLDITKRILASNIKKIEENLTSA